MIVGLQLLCCALSHRSTAELGMLRILSKAGTKRAACSLLSLQLPLAHVYGIEDPLCELLQLVWGVLRLLLQPQVVLTQVLDLCLEVGLVFFFLKEKSSRCNLGVPTHLAHNLGCPPTSPSSQKQQLRLSLGGPSPFPSLLNAHARLVQAQGLPESSELQD